MATQALKNGRPDLSKVAEHVFAIEDSWKSLKKELWVPLPVHWVQAASSFVIFFHEIAPDTHTWPKKS